MGVTTYCQASFNYTGETDLVAVEQPVADGRTVAADLLPFDACGFQLIEHRSAVTDWSDREEIDGRAATEFASMAKDFTGCDVVAVFDAIQRNPTEADRTADHAPILFVHSDYTDDYLGMVTDPDRPEQPYLQRALDRANLDQDALRSSSRLMVLQCWRNIGPTDPDYPLAVCDARDAGRERCVPFLIEEYGGEQAGFFTFGFRPPATGADHWYTFPSMGVDEAVLLRTYDSACADADRPFWTPHSAFRDPGVPDEPGNRRASVELRALCVWR